MNDYRDRKTTSNNPLIYHRDYTSYDSRQSKVRDDLDYERRSNSPGSNYADNRADNRHESRMSNSNWRSNRSNSNYRSNGDNSNYQSNSARQNTDSSNWKSNSDWDNSRRTSYESDKKTEMSSREFYYNNKKTNDSNYYGAPKSDDRIHAQNQNTTAYRPTANYGRATDMDEYSKYNVAPKEEKRTKLSVKTKVLVAVYAIIAVLVVVLILVNSIPNAKAQAPNSGTGTEQVVFDENANGVVVGGDGSQSNVEFVPSGDGYNYDSKTNWFDKMCDWVEKLVG